MGGYGSGRRKQHHITNDCITIDTAQLRKHKLLTGKKLSRGAQIKYVSTATTVKEKVTETHHELLPSATWRFQAGRSTCDLTAWTTRPVSLTAFAGDSRRWRRPLRRRGCRAAAMSVTPPRLPGPSRGARGLRRPNGASRRLVGRRPARAGRSVVRANTTGACDS